MQRAASIPVSYLGEGESGERWLWVWTGRRLEVAAGRSHGEASELPEADSTESYRGWYDPARQRMFVVGPRRLSSMKWRGRLPGALDQALRRRFGGRFEYRLF